MKNDNASERAVELVQQALDVLRRAEHAPASPVNAFLPANERRRYRREAARLRQGKTQPRYFNLYTSEQLAGIYERTIQRDEILDQALKDFERITRELGRVLEEDRAEAGDAMVALIREAKRSAEEHGPGSEAAHRYRLLKSLGWIGRQSHSHKRRQRTPAPRFVPLAPDPAVEARCQATAAEILPSAHSSGEPVIAIPPDGNDSGRGRMFIRIGIGEQSWVGSFERGHAPVTTISMMPDDKHLFVSANGAGYIIELESRTLVEATGTEVVEVMRDEPPTLFIVNHNGRSLEAFGKTGRLWKTHINSCGGFRNTFLTDTCLLGEARHPFRGTWVRFSVNLATGEVQYG